MVTQAKGKTQMLSTRNSNKAALILLFLSAVILISAILLFGGEFIGEIRGSAADGIKGTGSAVEESGDLLPNVSIDDWELILVNEQNHLPSDFSITTTEVNGYMVDERMADALREMLTACAQHTADLVLTSAYRSYEYQAMLYENKVAGILAEQNVTQDEAEAIAATEVAVPGTSEHGTGLAVDIYSTSYLTLDEGFADTDVGKWFVEHCTEYGFIIRYPENKQDITGIIYEPWHFRYVGVEAAKYISEHNLCLEEFIELLS